MASSRSGLADAAASKGKGVRSDEPCHENLPVEESGAQRGDKSLETPYVEEVEEIVRKESDLMNALSCTEAAAESETVESLLKAKAHFSMAGFDEASLLLVTKKMMDNMLRNKPSVPMSAASLADKVAEKLSRCSYVARERNNVNLMASRWDQNKLLVYPIRSGATVDSLIHIQFTRAVRIKNVLEAAYLMLSSDNVQEEVVDNFDLQELPEEKVLEILASGFIKAGTDYVDEVIKQCLTGTPHADGILLKDKLRRLKTHAEMVDCVREMGLVKESDFKATMQTMTIADLINLLLEETKKALETSLLSYALISNLTNSAETVNCRVFRFTCVGSALVSAKVGSTKNFKLTIDNDRHLSQIVVSLRCIENKRRASILRLEVTGDMRLKQRVVVKLYSTLYRSIGVIDVTQSEVMRIQDDVFDGFVSAELIDFADTEDNYAVINASGLVPMMVLGGLVPDNLEDPATNICWQLSLRSVVNNLCRLNRVFDSSIDRNHFLFSFKTAIIISSSLDSMTDKKKFIAQFFFWARFVDRKSTIVYSDYYVNSLANDKDQKIGSGLGAQCLWMASALFEINEICETGYCYLPIIIFYNMLCSGDYSAKLVNMGVWLTNSLNLNTDRLREDKKLMETMESLGVPVSVDWRRRLAMQPDIGSKIAVTIEMMREQMADIVSVVTGTSCTKTEAALLCKLSLMNVAEDDVVDEESSATSVNDITALVANKMKVSAEQGEMSHEDYLILVKELLRDLEDDDEIKQVLNAEGTKYHIIHEKLFMKKVEVARMAGKWKSADVGEEPCKLRRKDMERKLIRDFTNQTVAFSEKARNTMYQLTDFNASTMRDTLALNGAIITSFLHRMGSLGGKDINILLSKLAGKGIEGTSASLSADDVNLISLSSLETNESERGENSSMSSTTKLTLLEGLSVTVGISRTFDVTKMLEAVDRLTKQESRSSLKLKENLGARRLLLEDQASLGASTSEGVKTSIVISKRLIINAYFSSLIQEFRDCFAVMEFEGDEPAYKFLRGAMLVSAGLPMSVLSCISVIVRRLSDLVWDSITYLYDEIDETSKEQGLALSAANDSRARRAAKLSMETLKVALSSALISYKVSFTTYFSIADGSVCLIKRLCVKLSRKLYILIEREIAFVEVFFGFSDDLDRASKYVGGRRSNLCEYVTKRHSISAQEDGTSSLPYTLSEAESVMCTVVRPVRALNRIVIEVLNKTYESCLLASSRLFSFFSYCNSKIRSLYKYFVNKTCKSINSLTSIFKAASNTVSNILINFSLHSDDKVNKNGDIDDCSVDDEAKRITKGKQVVDYDVEADPRTPTVTACGLQITGSTLARSKSDVEDRDDAERGVEDSAPNAATTELNSQQAYHNTSMQTGIIETRAAITDERSATVEDGGISGRQAVLRIIEKREHRLIRFAGVMATRALRVARLLLEEWADTIEDVVYLVFTRKGYADERNIIRLSAELDEGSLRDYEQRMRAEASKNSFYFRTFKVAYDVWQLVFNKFIDVIKYATHKLGIILSYCSNSAKTSYGIIVTGLRQLRALITVESRSKTNSETHRPRCRPSETYASSDSNDRGEKISDTLVSITDTISEREASQEVHRKVIGCRREEVYITGRDSDSISDWLMRQDESRYDYRLSELASNADLRETKAAYFSFFQSGQPLDVQITKEKCNEKDSESARSEHLKQVVSVTALSEGDGVIALRSGEGHHASDDVIACITDEVRNRISEVAWMHETGLYLSQELKMQATVSWVLSSVAGTEKKHLLRHIGKANFDKIVILTGDLDEANLNGIETRLNALVSLAHDGLMKEDHAAETAADIKANLDISAEIIDEVDLSDKLAEMIAQEFEQKISLAIKQSRKRCYELRLIDESEDASVNAVEVTTESPNEQDECLEETTEEVTFMITAQESQEPEDEDDLVEQGYMRYDSSPVTRMLSKLASFTNLSPRKMSGSSCNSKSGVRFELTSSDNDRGLSIAMDQPNTGYVVGSNQTRTKRALGQEANSEKKESELSVSLTGLGTPSSITAEVAKLLTKSLKGNLVNCFKNWVGASDQPSDEITVKLIENNGQLSRDDLREIKLRGNASFAPIWDSIDDVLHSAVECDKSKEESNVIEIFGKRRLLKHGKDVDNVKYLLKKEIDIVDVGDVSILCLPNSVTTMRENLANRAKYVNKSVDTYSCSLKAVCDITAGMSTSKVMKGKNCVIRNDSLGVEMLMVPNHLNAYGKNLPVSDVIDALDCIALSHADSLRLMTPKQLLTDLEKGDDDAVMSGILARQEFDTSSAFFSIVSVDAVDWRGKSGAPVVDNKGTFLGIILMQITDGKYFNVLNDAGIIICAKPNLVARPILHSTNVRVAKCAYCRVSANNRARRNGDDKSSESGSEVSVRADNRRPDSSAGGGAKVCIKCADVERARNQTDVCEGAASTSTGQIATKCADCLATQRKLDSTSRLERGKRMLLAGLNYVIGRDAEEHQDKLDDSVVSAFKTGALERIGEILASDKRKQPDSGASDDIVIHNISEILYYSDQQAMDNLTRIVLSFTLEQLVKGNKPVIVCGTNVCCLTVTLLLSSLRLRFERARTVSDLQRVCCAAYKKTSKTTVVASIEDITCSALSKEKMTLSNQHFKVKCLMLISDNVAVKNCSLATLKILSLFMDNMTVIMYDCRKLNCATGASDTAAAEKLKCIETKRIDTYQNCGVFHHLRLSNSIIEIAETNGFGDDSESGEIRSVVITMCNNASDYTAIKNRLSKAIDVNAKSILVANYSAFASKQIWEVIRTCKNIYLHTGTKATYLSEIVVNCSLDTDMAFSEKNLFLEAYSIASRLTLDEDYGDDTMMTVMTLKDMNSETNLDRNWFTIDYLNSNISSSYNAYDLLRKINLTFIETNTIVQQVSVIENKFRMLRTDNEQIMMTLTDEDLINENLVARKRGKKPILNVISMKMSELLSSAKWAWHNVTIGALMLVRRVKESMAKMVNRSKHVLKMRMLRLAAGMKRAGRNLLRVALSPLRVNRTASYFNQNGNGLDATGASRAASSLYRCAGLTNLAACVSGYKKKHFSDETKIDHSIMALMASAGFETISKNLPAGVRSTYECIGNLLATVTGVGELAYLILGWKKIVLLGNWRVSSCGVSANKVVTSKLSQALKAMTQEMRSIEVVQTGLIVDDVRTKGVNFVTYLNMYELGLSIYELTRKLWMSLRLSKLFSNLRKGIEYRNDHPFPPQRGLEVVPCYEISPAVSSVILIGTTGVIALSLAFKRVETAVSTIAVITEKKHTYDMVEVYKQDRDLGSILFRTANVGYGLFLISTGGKVACAVGAASLCLGVVDMATNSFSELGVCYSLSHILVRMYTAKNKIRAAANGWSAWYGRKSTIANGVNALVLTGMPSKLSDGDFSDVTISNIKLKMVIAQHKERLANGVLMDKSVEASKAYDNAKIIVLGRKSVSDLNDAVRWDHEIGASAELLDLNLIANKGVGADSWNRANSTLVSLDELTINQCRFVGRTKKLLKFDKQMVPDEMIEHQSSVLALNDRLWYGVVSDSDREGWGAAGDSRYAVLLAIAERNDSPIVLQISDEIMEMMIKRGLELLNKIIPMALKAESKVNSLDWLTVLCNINERATSGILTRLRTGQQVTAGYLPNFGYRSELLCEMLHDDSMPDECSVINVFAKRRVEKKKRSRLTGIECVITRTIQANEVDLKVACSGSFMMLDKLIKLTKSHNGLAIGLNFFIEFATDELNTSAECYRSQKISNVRRISLDHSSFDSSQRNWSITLCRELRMMANEIVLLNEDREKRKLNELIGRIYDGLLIRLMLTTHGDLFAVTGQQMSGHATTSSDNSIKAYLYAMVTCDLMKKSFRCDMIENSLRAQGDDTKFDIIVDSGEISDSEISASISSAMSKLGQVVKSEKIEVLRVGESSSFLSNRCGLAFFLMRKGVRKDVSWFESHLIPVRKRRDLISMLATILKSSSKRPQKKSKKDISLLAAKSMSFLTMYVGDALVARICITVIWICFKVLTAFENVSSKVDITSAHLPWFVEQSGVKGEFEIKLFELMSMHGIARKELNVFPDYWLVDKLDPDFSMIDLPVRLLRNARAVFPHIRDWEDDALMDSIAASDVSGYDRLLKINVTNVDRQLNGIREGLTLSIIEATVPYEPFNRLKRKVKVNKTFISSLGLKKVFVIPKVEGEEEIVYWKVLRHIESPLSEEVVNGDLTTKDGLIVRGLDLKIMTCKEYKIGIVDSEIKARMTEVNPWNVIRLMIVKEDVTNLVRQLGNDCSDCLLGGFIITDLNLLNRFKNYKELNEDLDRSLEGASLDRLSKLKVLIKDESKDTTRCILIVKDKLWWKPIY